MTDAQFTAWLKSPSAIRCLLVEAVCQSGGQTVTRYLSSVGYTTGAADTPANTGYLPIITGGVKYSQEMSFSGINGLSGGDIEIINLNGERDSWLDDVWYNRSIQMFVGDVRWPRADFRLVFNGVIADIDSKRRERLNIKLRDKLERLNSPAIETKLKDALNLPANSLNPNKERTLPLVFGEVHNIEPLLIDPANHLYQVHAGAIEDVIEVRDNGVPITVVEDLPNGKFSLTQTPVGTITASVQGDKSGVYYNSVAKLVTALATRFGKASTRFTAADLDQPALDAFDAAHPQAVGVQVLDRVNVLQACQQLAASIGAQLTMTPEGKLQLLQLSAVGSGTAITITGDDMVAQNLSVAERVEVVAAVKLAYCMNYAVQESLESGIVEEHKALFKEEWLKVTSTSPTTQTNYLLDVDPEEEDTLLIDTAEAQAEADRRLALKSVQRTIYQFDAFPQLMLTPIGQAVILKHPRYGLAAGKAGVVVGRTPDWTGNRINLKVMV